MGDRANVCIKSGATEPPIYFYTHWHGEDLPATIARGLARGRPRWGDTPYLSRILFCEMVKGSESDLTGFGIAWTIMDNQIGRPILVVDDHLRRVGLARQEVPDEPYRTVSYEEFIADPTVLPWDGPTPPRAEDPGASDDPVKLLRTLLEVQDISWVANQIWEYLSDEAAIARGEDDTERATRLAAAASEAGNFAAEMETLGL